MTGVPYDISMTSIYCFYSLEVSIRMLILTETVISITIMSIIIIIIIIPLISPATSPFL